MTTVVNVHAQAGWPVKVTPVSLNGSEVAPPRTVEAGKVETFYVHSGQDLLIHEIQRDEEDDGA